MGLQMAAIDSSFCTRPHVLSGFYPRSFTCSCAYFPEGVTSLDDAELAMLELYCERAQLVDGQNILELGCGWGSFTLYAANKYRGSTITAVSNSATQRAYIEGECR